MKKLDYLEEVFTFGNYRSWSAFFEGILVFSILLMVVEVSYYLLAVIMLSLLLALMFSKLAYDAKFVEAHYQEVREEVKSLKEDIFCLEDELERSKKLRKRKWQKK